MLSTKNYMCHTDQQMLSTIRLDYLEGFHLLFQVNNITRIIVHVPIISLDSLHLEVEVPDCTKLGSFVDEEGVLDLERCVRFKSVEEMLLRAVALVHEFSHDGLPSEGLVNSLVSQH